MDKTILYKKLDIDTPEEFKYYENLAALLEEDDFIEENLLKDLISEIDRGQLAEHMESYFEDFLRNLPDEENELYITVDNIARYLSGLIADEMSREEIAELASAIARFRKWYVHDLNVFDRIKGEESNIRDARFNIMAAGFLGEESDYDFRTAYDFVPDGYDIRL
jgi:hypothetical protein